ncbi:hypothetical protein Tco_1243931 [Tanacetum coccineum]
MTSHLNVTFLLQSDFGGVTADKRKKVITREEQSSEEERGSKSESDDEIHPSGPMVETFKPKKLKKFAYTTEYEEELEKKIERRRIGIRWDEVFKHMRKKIDDFIKMGDYLEMNHSIPLVGTVLGMIFFNDLHRQDFISINDFDDLNDEALYTVQETFLRFDQGLGVDDLESTFNSFLLTEVNKRNLNPDMQMKVIEQLRQ